VSEPQTLAATTAPEARGGRWLQFALLTTAAWGVWGALIGLPAEHGFPDTLSYVVWALTMVLPAAVSSARAPGKIERDRRSLALGTAIGLLGAGGQLVLFHAVTIGPPYLIFPIVALSPVVTILLSLLLLRERTGALGWTGIALAVIALPMFDYDPNGAASGLGPWFVLAVAVLFAWGLQAFFIKLANATMSAESIFVYMTLTGLALIPVAFMLTDFSKPVYLGLSGPWLAAGIQLLNAVGALLLVHAFREGKAIVVSPLVNAAAPMLTALISLAIAGTLPPGLKILGMALALTGALLLSFVG
jgi:uncharacterized membrane protein